MSRIRKRQTDFKLLDQPFVSIIIVTYQTGGQFIENCLNSLRQLDYQNFEIIIVDNNSTDDTREVLKQQIQNEILILNKSNRGFGGGCNDGTREAKGEVMVYLNMDTVVEKDWLTNLIKPFQQNPRTAITGCKMYYPDSKKIQHAGGILHPNGMTEHIGYGKEDNGDYDQTQEVDFVTGASFAARKEFLDLCGGGFDEAYFPAYYEETDLCYRAKLMGYQTLFVHDAVLTHFESPLLNNASDRFHRICYRSRIIFCWQNFTLSDWLFKWLPKEISWLRAPYSKGFRKKQITAYLDLLKFIIGFKFDPSKIFSS